MFTDPTTFAAHKTYALSDFRKNDKLAEENLAFYVVDLHGVRLYCVAYPHAKTPGVIGIWQHTGTGLSTRASEELLKFVDTEFTLVEESPSSSNTPPEPTYLPESDAHGGLRRRIRDLLHRAPRDPDKVATVSEADVFLYNTGMAAIYNANKVLISRDPGTILVLGSIFHNTWHLFEEAPGGMKHFGACDAASGVMEKVEAFLEEHYSAGKTVSYVFLEFPSNPILVSADLQRLRDVTTKYAVPILLDDTIGSFANIDVLPLTDLLITSLTKSFSGYADVMGGSIVLNPLSPLHTPSLAPRFTTTFHNELHALDAAVLLSNSADYLPRSAILNRNAALIASFLAAHATATPSPVTKVLYPSVSDTKHNYDAVLRPPTPDFPAPGYGCLLSVDFRLPTAARAFYNAFPAHNGPHLGAHRMLAAPFNALVLGKDPEMARYYAGFGVGMEQVRISAGLEEEGEVLAAARFGLEAAVRAMEEGGEEAGLEGGVEGVVGGGEKTGVEAVALGTSANFE